MGASRVHHRHIRTALVIRRPLTEIKTVVLSAPLLPQRTVLVTRQRDTKMPMVVTSDLQTAILTVLGIPVQRIPMAMVDLQDLQTATQTVLEIQRPPIAITMARLLVLRRAIRILSEILLQSSAATIRIPASGVGNNKLQPHWVGQDTSLTHSNQIIKMLCTFWAWINYFSQHNRIIRYYLGIKKAIMRFFY